MQDKPDPERLRAYNQRDRYTEFSMFRFKGSVEVHDVSTRFEK